MTEIENPVASENGEAVDPEVGAPIEEVEWVPANPLDFGFQPKVHAGKFDPDRVRFLVYGVSGVGKTRFACGWNTPFVINIDDGLASVDWEVTDQPVTNKYELEQVMRFLETEAHQYDTIVLDSLPELQHLLMDDIILNFPGVRRAYNDLASQSDYGKMLADFDDIVRRLKGLQRNIVLIANVQNIEQTTDMVKPQLIGKATADTLCRMMDIVGFMQPTELHDGSRATEMILYSSQHICKDRSGKLPSKVIEPTYKKLVEIWTGSHQ